VPTAVAVFAHQFIDDGTPPREWAERLYNVRRWTPMPRGGHFPSAEEPDLLSRDIAAFFNDPGAGDQPEMRRLTGYLCPRRPISRAGKQANIRRSGAAVSCRRITLRSQRGQRSQRSSQ
jgi:hypothetical protein